MSVKRFLAKNADASSEILSVLLNDLPGIICIVITPNNLVTECNDWTARLLSPTDDMSGKSILDFLPNESLEEWDKLNTPPYQGVLRFRDSIGLEMPFLSRIVKIRDHRIILGNRHNPSSQRIFDSMTKQLNRSYADIARLRVRRQQMMSLVKALPLMLIFVDEDGQILEWTPHCETVLGYSCRELEIHNPGFAQVLNNQESTRVVTRNGKPIELKISHISTGSDIGGFWSILQPMGLEYDFSEAAGIVGIMDDLTELIMTLSEEDGDPQYTDQERRILDLVLENMPNDKIGVRMGISVSTVKAHISSIMRKARIKNRRELLGSVSLERSDEPMITREIESIIRRLKSDLSMSQAHAMTYFRDRQISRREHDTIRLVIRGLSNKEIGEILHISLPTVKSHLHSAYRKLGIKNRTEFFQLMAKLEEIHTSGQ